MHGRRAGGLDLGASLSPRTTDGQDGRIEADTQTLLDALFGTRASYAPGRINAGRKDIDLRLQVGRGERWRLKAGYQGMRDLGTGTGSAGPGGMPTPVGRLTDAAGLGSEAFDGGLERRDLFGFVQDEWRLAPGWSLTAGVRVDQYDSFGTTANPRLSLVWQADPKT